MRYGGEVVSPVAGVPAAHSGFFAAPGHERRLRGTRNFTKRRVGGEKVGRGEK
jgi:hypothetical protein